MAHERAGQLVQPSDLIDVVEPVTAYYAKCPSPNSPDQKIVFGTSGHRGSSLDGAFNKDHVHAVTQTIVDYRKGRDIEGSLCVGCDTHGLPKPAMISALKILTANDTTVTVDVQDRYTPTPAASHMVPAHNCDVERGPTGSSSACAGSIVITPPHNPPRSGSFKYNPPTGGPTGTDTTSWIAACANEYLARGLDGVKYQLVDRVGGLIVKHDCLSAYIPNLPNVVNLDTICDVGVHIGADPMGDTPMDYQGAIGNAHNLNLIVVDPLVNAAWRFITLGTDDKIRMDCFSPNAIAFLIGNHDKFDIPAGSDADSDRHGIVIPDTSLMSPSRCLAVAIDHPFVHYPGWSQETVVGKTLASLSMIDCVAANLGRELVEAPIGLKWPVPGLPGGTIGFSDEEPVSTSLLRHNDAMQSTDESGIILDLLANRVRTVTGKTPSQLYAGLADKYGTPAYTHTDADAIREQEAVLKKLSPKQVKAGTLARETITAKLAGAPGNGAAASGLRVVTENVWFTARLPGTEDKYRVHAESFRGTDRPTQVQAEARDVISVVLNG